MRTNLLMIASSILLGATGIFLTFFPAEILEFLDVDFHFSLQIFLQMTGAANLSFAVINWMSKSNLIGGIYSRPMAVGNFGHFFIGSLAMLKGASASMNSSFFYIGGSIYLVFSLFFFAALFIHPVRE